MIGCEVENLSMELLNALQHSTSLGYFSLLVANVVSKSLYLSLKDVHEGLVDLLALTCFFFGVIAFSSFYLLGRSGRLEWLGFIALIWASAIPFIYFQYYHEKYTLIFFLSVICFSGARCMAAVYHGGTETFRRCCIGFALLALSPAIIACFRTSHCRYSMCMAYIKYAVYNGIGVLFYLVQFPERLFLTPGVSNVILHLCILGSAATFSVALLAAYESPNNPYGIKCAWWE